MYKTAESVTKSHPDKVCDQISDAIVDACLVDDPLSRCAIETMGGSGKIFITGELTTTTTPDFEAIAKRVYFDCGYIDDVSVITHISHQSSEIKSGVDNNGAGDQGIMVGYACNETPEMMPREYIHARNLTRIMGARDGKSQVTLDNWGNLVRVVTSVSNKTDTIESEIKDYLAESFPNLSRGELQEKWLSNPNGNWTISGFSADAGLTGRKIVVDAYGPRVPVGGGAFSGKDATKVDRSGAYMARKIAVDLLKKHSAQEVLVEISYSIGLAEPLSLHAVIDGVYYEITEYDVRPQSIIKQLNLQKPQFEKTARECHFGNGFSWDMPFSA